MKIAVIGGTHGNEPTGIRVVKDLEKSSKTFLNSYKAFLGNPKAFEQGKRYVDSDLNRAFGEPTVALGNEKVCSEVLKKEIQGNFDFILDLHTTTSNMGLTIILTHLDENSLKSACFLKNLNPELKIIISVRAGKECPYTTSMTKSGLTVEVGPVANNVINAELILATHKMVTQLLDFDFKETFDYSKFECFQTYGLLSYPNENEEEWMLHPNVDGNDFTELTNGEPLFINLKGEIMYYEGDSVYPLFVNEAAYQENNTALEYARKIKLSSIIGV